jgi:pimeloyl-ACP methyl ester carboxylesterase/NAD(P)-dependent dehydrogenase (short-subunit alcohol dehydrogenase family)/acyl carrier protein
VAPESAATWVADALAIAQSCVDARREIKFWIVTRGAQPPNANSDPAGLAHAPLIGLGRVLAIELQQAWGGGIDVGSRAEDTCDSILRWITSSRSGEEVAINNSGAYAPHLSEAVAPWRDPRLIVHADKSYLVTGGIGGVGLSIARALVESGARRLMLLARGEPSGAALAAVKEMESLGASCTLRRGDVAVRRDVEDAIATFGNTLPELAGIVHAAGVVHDAMLPSITRGQLSDVLSPKVAGAWNLHEVVGNRPLDFFVMMSSLSSVLGSAGQASYSAANAFLDCLAYHRQALGLRGLTINWGPWADTGMTSQLSETIRARWAVQGITPLHSSEAADLFMQLAGTRATQRVAAIVDWQRFRQSRTDALPILRNFGGAVSESVRPVESVLDQFESTPAAERGPWLSAWIRRKAAGILKVDQSEVLPERSLLELGFDSLMVMELLRAIGQEFRIRTYPREFYERPSAEGFAAYLLDEIAPLPISLRSAEARNVPATHKIEAPVAFLLSAPRSGSTLLRVMLAGHPLLFCPPELHLLGFNTMGERKSSLQGSYLEEGLVRAIKELKAVSAEEAQALAKEWVDSDLPVAAVYERLQEMAQGRLLIDKSPSYAGSIETLKNAKALFASAKYIHLVRHPLSVMDSFVKNRFDRLLGLTAQSPRDAAEKVWVESNANLVEFLGSLDPTQSITLRYEDLVRTPAAVMKQLCSFLEVPFDEAVLQPYEGCRMTDGLRSQSVGIGDPGFLEHKGIDASLAEVWQKVDGAESLGLEARRLAAKFEYDLPASAGADGRMTEHFVDVRGLSMCLCSWGPTSGHPIFILHGILDHGGAWDDVALSLAKRGFRVFAPDQRGHGRSQHAGPEASYHLMDFLADADTLLKQITTGPVTLVGHSMGAAIAAMLTAARPELVSRVVLVESILASDRNPRKASEVLSAHLNALEMEARPHPLADASTAAKRLQEFYPSMEASQAMKMAARLLEPCTGGVRWRWDERLRSRAGLAFHGTFDLGAGRFLSILNDIRRPVTLVVGTDSEFVSQDQADRQLAELREGRKTALRGGHNLHLDCPAELADAISKEFIARSAVHLGRQSES